MSGLICSRLLAEHGFRVTLVDKARGPGGRMSTRRTEHGSFDHGAQYFTTRDPRFIEQAESWIAVGVAREWTGRLAAVYPHGISILKGENARLVGVPQMSAITRHLAAGLELTTSWHVDSLQRRAGQWWLRARNGAELGPIEAAVAAVPGPQAAALLTAAPELAEAARSATMAGCYAVMLAGRWTSLSTAPSSTWVRFPGSRATAVNRGVTDRRPGCCTPHLNGQRPTSQTSRNRSPQC